MWLFTQNGFTSVVQHKENPQLLVVRFRDKQDAKTFAQKLNTRLAYTPNNDYHWRVVVSRVKLRKLITKMIAEIDYTNFKDRIHKQRNPSRDKAYSEVWADMFLFQERGEQEEIKYKFYQR